MACKAVRCKPRSLRSEADVGDGAVEFFIAIQSVPYGRAMLSGDLLLQHA